MSELYHYGVKGMKWGVRRRIDANKAYANSMRESNNRNKQIIKDRIGGKSKSETGKIKSGIGRRVDAAKAYSKSMRDSSDANKQLIKESVKNIAGSEIGKRGKSAIDVLMNGDKDWMGNSINSDDVGTEAKNRGKAALERLMYSQEQIDNKKFYGRYDF